MVKNTFMMMFVAFVLFVLSATASFAFCTGTYDKGFLVPVTVHNGSTLDTVVGVLCTGLPGTHDEMEVYWTFFDKNSNPVVDGQFTCSNNDYEPFSLNQSAPNTNGVEGYLVFTAGSKDSHAIVCNDNSTIAGNSFIVDIDSDDAIFVPVIPLSYSDYKAGTDISAMTSESIQHLSHGLVPKMDSFVDVRVWLDPDFGAKTTIVIWSTACLRDDIEADNCYKDDLTDEFKCHVDSYDDDENRQSISIPLGCELTTLNPEDIVGWPGFKDGFIRIPINNLLPDEDGGAFVFSYISSDVFQAAQTLLAAQYLGSCATEAPSDEPPSEGGGG